MKPIIFYPERKSTSAPVPDPIIEWNNESRIMNLQCIPANIARTCPDAYRHRAIEDLIPFLEAAWKYFPKP